MPANPKYLTSSPLQRLAKITAGFIGGYLVTQTFHMALALWWDVGNMVMTLRFGGFVLWAVLMILAFLAKNGWRVWGLYLLISLFFYLLIFLGKTTDTFL